MCNFVFDFFQVLADASSVAKKPLELVWVHSPEKGAGIYAPPTARNLSMPAPCDALGTFNANMQ